MKIFLTTLVAISIASAIGTQAYAKEALPTQKKSTIQTTNNADAKEDTRGHQATPMTEERFLDLLAEYNSDKNQEITWSEFNQWRLERFNKTDSDNNDYVDAEEYVYEFEGRLDDSYDAWREGQVKQTYTRFKALDDDENGIMSRVEYDHSGQRIFGRFDTNKDNAINDSDPLPVNERRQQRNTELSETEKQAQRLYRRRTSLAHVDLPTTHKKEGVVAIYDTNFDQQVQAEEFLTGRNSAFQRTDKDNSGGISEDEYVLEFEDRLDTAIESSRHAAVKQTYVRFEALDDNADKKMTFAEFQISGKRMFTRWDKNDDGVISHADVNAKDNEEKY